MSTEPKSLIVSDPNGVKQQLNELDLDLSILEAAVKAAALGRLAASQLHPNTSGGYMQWSEGVAAFREAVLPSSNWESVNVHNRGLTVNRERGVVVAIAGGDSDTGQTEGKPTTRAKKGPTTKRSIQRNANQGEMFPEYFALPEEIKDDTYGAFWLLLVHVDVEGREVRSELSKPVGWRTDRRPSGFTPRVILPVQPIGGETLNRRGQSPSVLQTPEIRIDIKRRA